MKNTKRIVTGLAFAATLALSTMAGGGDAYARVKSGGGQIKITVQGVTASQIIINKRVVGFEAGQLLIHL